MKNYFLMCINQYNLKGQLLSTINYAADEDPVEFICRMGKDGTTHRVVTWSERIPPEDFKKLKEAGYGYEVKEPECDPDCGGEKPVILKTNWKCGNTDCGFGFSTPGESHPAPEQSCPECGGKHFIAVDEDGATLVEE